MLIPFFVVDCSTDAQCRPHSVFVPTPQTKFHYSNHDNCLARHGECNNALRGRALRVGLEVMSFAAGTAAVKRLTYFATWRSLSSSSVLQSMQSVAVGRASSRLSP